MPRSCDPLYYPVVQKARASLATYADMEELIRLGAYRQHHRARLPRHTSSLKPGMAAAQRWMPGKRQLARRIEDAHAVIRRWIGRWQKERGFRETQPPRQRQHLRSIHIIRAMHHRQRIAAKRARAEYIHQIEFHHISPLKLVTP
jgi:hypothetical protein